jgi:hypothetical protein
LGKARLPVSGQEQVGKRDQGGSDASSDQSVVDTQIVTHGGEGRFLVAKPGFRGTDETVL